MAICTVCLFDEPVSNLDAQLRLDMRREIIELQKSLGVTSVWVTHDQEGAMAMGDELMVINKGKVEQHDSPEEIYANPVNADVGRMIGSPPMNLIAGEIHGDEYVGPGFRVTVGKGAPQGPIMLGLRPEDLHVADELSPGTGTNSLEARVELVELLGPRASLTLRIGEATVAGVFNRRVLPRLPERSIVSLAAERSRLQFFDRDVGRRISISDRPDAPMATIDRSASGSSTAAGAGERA